VVVAVPKGDRSDPLGWRHLPTDQKVGGSNPSERAAPEQEFFQPGSWSAVTSVPKAAPEVLEAFMGKVVSIERHRTMRLADAIERKLRANNGSGFVVDAGKVDDLRAWRQAAVIALHRLGYKARTWVGEDRLAVIVDRPISAAEKRWAAEAVSAVIRPGPRPLAWD
jgi:hypothetical protein